MEHSLTATNLSALAGVMMVGALIPSMSVLVVSARSATLGLFHGVLTSLGIVLGDIVFILIAIYGLTLLAQFLGSHFALIKYLGAAYLIWLGIVLWRASSNTAAMATNQKASAWSSFLTGLLITLGDQKAILFYLGFLPAFVDLSVISLAETATILFIAIIAVGTPKLVYAFIAHRVGGLFKTAQVGVMMNRLAGSEMIGVGLLLIIKVY